MRTAWSNRAGAVAVPSVRAAQALARSDARIVDLRSPSEFAHDHLPGARNVPLFDDVERALVGTLYRKVSPQAAFEEGRSITRAKVARLVGAIAAIAEVEVDASDLERRVDRLTSEGIVGLGTIACAPLEAVPERALLLHCWRGGLRSKSVAALLAGLGVERAVLLEGGYRAYRAEVAREIESWRPPPIFLLCGLTGVGKTLVLRAIERLSPGRTLDLEALADHRSSLLGMVGRKPRSQKAFESALAARIRSGFGPRLFVEAESRKVGDVILPLVLWRAMRAGTALELTAPIERRVTVLAEDYLASEESRRELLLQLPRVEDRMELPASSPSLATMLEEGRVDELVRLLLERYYDPLYRHSERGRRYAGSLDASDPEEAAAAILRCASSPG